MLIPLIRIYKTAHNLVHQFKITAAAGGRNLSWILNNIRTMSSSLDTIPKVDIDPSGVFKYILIKVHDPKTEQESCVTIVRGYGTCEYHADIFDKVQEKLKKFDCECIGGGRISHEPQEKKIHIYGYSQGYGKADHEVTAKLVKEAFPEYKVSISDEGY